MMDKPRYSLFFYFLSRYKHLCGAIVLITLVTSLLESLSVAAFFPLFSSLMGASQEKAGGILGFISRMGGLLPFPDPLVSAAVLLILVFSVKILLTILREVLMGYGSAKVLYSVKQQIIERYAGAQYQFFLDSKQGTLFFNLLSAPHGVIGVLFNGLQMVASLLKVLAIVIVLGFIFPLAALAFAGLGLLFYGVTHYLSIRVSFRLGREGAEAGMQQNVIANELLSGIQQIITFGTARRWVERFERENRALTEMYMKQAVWSAMPRPVMELLGVVLILGAILILRAISTDNFAEVLVKLGIFAVALAQILPAVTSLGQIRMTFMGALPTAELAYDAITDPIPRREDGHRVLESFEKAIAFENVSFAHKGRETLLKGVDLTIEKGKVTAIVGPSGAGKTTIINLILGLFEPTEGRITIDGVPLQEFKQETWLSKIGPVSQDTFTYHSTVADNVLFGRNGHSIDSLVKAAKIANAHEFISDLPQDYDTIVGERGMKLSGGQQQRLAIARAVLDTPEILIFDEATSSLDTISEKLVQEAIEKASSDRTVIIIAHRLSTIRRADKIIVLDDGQVEEEGNHQELLSMHGHYSRLVDSAG
jgi:ABC-type multidrug transport system fused ATPase/permease subunit